MALNQLRLSLMTFPQRVTPSGSGSLTLDLRLLLLPVGDPTAAIDAGWPAFAGATLQLNVCVIDSLDSLPTNSSVITLQVPFTATPPANAPALFNLLKKNLTDKGATVNTNPPVSPDGVDILKALPASYTDAIPFSQPRTKFARVGDGFGCAIRGQQPNLTLTPPQPVIAWGQILSFALRQRVLAQALGLIYPLSITLTPPLLKDGGWIYVTLDTTPGVNPYTAEWLAAPGNFDFLRRFAARIPAIGPTADRTLFAAQLFPVVDTPDGVYDDVQVEAEEYDDGFAKIIHCNQPATIDAATAQADQVAPGAEAGIQLGWDDEQLTIWCNRQLQLLRFALGAPFDVNNPEAALGVQGYRVDVRESAADPWASLCLVTGTLNFNGASGDATGTTPLPAPAELWIEPTPLRPTPASGPNSSEAWLPLYFAQWRGSSLVVHDDTTSKLTPGGKTLPSNFLQAFLGNVPTLLYGHDYQFQVRLTDLTGGGPLSTDPPTNPALAPIGKCHFVRHIPPKALITSQTPAPPAITRGTFPTVPSKVPTPDPTLAIQTISVQRPRLGYPEAVFAGVAPATFTGASLDALIADALASHSALNVPDPDVDRFAVTVEARLPAYDVGTAGTLPDQTDGLYRVVYRVELPFNANVVDPDPTVTLNLNYQDVHQISDLATFTPVGTTIVIPTARDIRIRLQPLCQPRLNYYAGAQPPLGLVTDFIVRQEAAAESALFPIDPAAQVKAIYLQPSDNQAQTLAQALDLKVDNLTFTGDPGVRTVFACSQALRHTLASDYSSITFANQPEFLSHWIVALEFNLDRDWTWEGFAEPAFTISPTGTIGSPGSVSYPRAVSQLALGDLSNAPDRSTSRILFFDAVEPKPLTGFPAELNPQWNVICHFPSAPALAQLYTTRLPITVPPAQTPKIAATGIALSPFQHDDAYSSTDPRQRLLWIEFEKPPADPDDTYFARVLASGPDPLLSVDLIPSPLAEPVAPPLPVDPEPIRLISPGESDDASGLDAMTQLIPAASHTKGLHYLLPLPAGVSAEALELFSFWTYEFRVGHKYDLGKDSLGKERFRWSTAQGRYGAPLIVAGVQHPAPHLVCAIQRTPQAIIVSAPYATTVNNGVRFIDTFFGDPRTEIVVMLYAQVTQIDGESNRNILLSHLVLAPQNTQPIFGTAFIASTPRTRDVIGVTVFFEDQVDAILGELRLSKLTPLSVLAVEILPGDDFGKTDVRRQQPRIDFLNLDPADFAADPSANDALGSNLGNRRILRTSPLTPVPAIC